MLEFEFYFSIKVDFIIIIIIITYCHHSQDDKQ